MVRRCSLVHYSKCSTPIAAQAVDHLMLEFGALVPCPAALPKHAKKKKNHRRHQQLQQLQQLQQQQQQLLLAAPPTQLYPHTNIGAGTPKSLFPLRCLLPAPGQVFQAGLGRLLRTRRRQTVSAILAALRDPVTPSDSPIALIGSRSRTLIRLSAMIR